MYVTRSPSRHLVILLKKGIRDQFDKQKILEAAFRTSEEMKMENKKKNPQILLKNHDAGGYGKILLIANSYLFQLCLGKLHLPASKGDQYPDIFRAASIIGIMGID